MSRILGISAFYHDSAAALIVDGDIAVGPMITHRLPWEQTPDAYHLLYNKPEEAMAVILEWD